MDDMVIDTGTNMLAAVRTVYLKDIVCLMHTMHLVERCSRAGEHCQAHLGHSNTGETPIVQDPLALSYSLFCTASCLPTGCTRDRQRVGSLNTSSYRT